MKSFKLMLTLAMMFSSIAVVSTLPSSAKSVTSVVTRVRTVPSSSSSDQKKKEDENAETPKPQNTASKEKSGLFCSQTNSLKTTLAVANGGAPK